MKIQADLSVCTTVFRSGNSLKSLLSSLYSNAGPVSLEVIAVDMGVGLAYLLGKQFPKLIVYEDPLEKNSVGAINRAFNLATGRYLSILDSDVIVRPGCLQKMLDFLDDTPDVGIAGPMVTDAYGNMEESRQRFTTLFSSISSLSPFKLLGLQRYGRLYDDSPSLPAKRCEVEWLQSGMHIIRREVFEEIGFFDSSFPRDMAEMDYYLRANRAGWHNYFCPDAEIFHPNPVRYRQELRRPEPLTRAVNNSIRFLWKKRLSGKNLFQAANF